jgi:hypothetical protein
MRYLICSTGLRRTFVLRRENFQAGKNLEYVNNDRNRTILFLYTVGSRDPSSAVGLLVASPSSILHRSRMTSSVPWGYACEPAPRDTAIESCTSQRFPFSSKITRLWLFVSPEASKYVSMMSGGGLFVEASQVRHVHNCSRRRSVSSNSTLNCFIRSDKSASGLDSKKSETGRAVTYPTVHFWGI